VSGEQPPRLFCKQPARGVLLFIPPSAAGGRPRYEPVPCGRSNSCEYCARRAAIENVLVVDLDSRKGSCPGHSITLTTRDPDFDPVRFTRAIAQWFRWLRCEVGPVEYLGLIEWTTGKGARSGGRRRMHQHTLVKGLPDDADLYALWRSGKRRWDRLTGAHRVELRELRSPAGATAYTVAHHHKTEQAPPRGWKGKRFRPSKGYFDRPVPELREEIKARMAAVAARRAIEAVLDNVCYVKLKKPCKTALFQQLPHKEDGMMRQRIKHHTTNNQKAHGQASETSFGSTNHEARPSHTHTTGFTTTTRRELYTTSWPSTTT
jgi:hypothetical protein